MGAPFTAKGTRGGETSSGMVAFAKGPRKNREDLFLEVAYAGGPGLTLSCIEEASIAVTPKAEGAAGWGRSQARVCESLSFQKSPVCGQQLLLG